MTPISKILSLLLTVLIVTSLFVPAVAAAERKWSIAPEEALEFRVDCGYLTRFTADGVGYQYKDDDVWDIYTGIGEKREIIADNDEKRKELLDFMWFVDYLSGCDPYADGALGIRDLLIFPVMFITIDQRSVPILSEGYNWHHDDEYTV